MQEELKRKDKSGQSILFMISQWCRNYFTPLYRWGKWILGKLSNFEKFNSFCCVTVLEKAEVGTQAEFQKICWVELNGVGRAGDEHAKSEGLPDEPEVCVV